LTVITAAAAAAATAAALNSNILMTEAGLNAGS